MSMIGELRQVPVTLFPALHDKATRERVATTLMASDGPSLDKLWNALAFVLERACGEDPIGAVGDPLHGVDTGYGPPLLLTAEDVRGVAAALAEVDDDAVRAAYDPDGMADDELYCQPGPGEAERAAYLDELLVLVRAVRAFFADAAARGHGVLNYLT